MSSTPLLGNSNAIEQLRESIRKVAQTDMTVLIQGETGTGKELVAQAVHHGSRRAGGPFVAVNCANFQETLIESELFGHEKGAFTGADARRKGKFELADHGTLFLDEIGDISLPAQAKLLRVLETREVDRLGSSAPVPVDFRVVVATHKNLEGMVEAGMFRQDLFYRLNVYMIRTPALRDRPEDIPLLARHFARRNGNRTLSEGALQALRSCPWPGNVRELQYAIQRAAAISDGDRLTAKDIAGTRPPERMYPEAQNYRKAMDERARELYNLALGEADGNASKAARILGLSRAAFRRLAHKHSLA